MTARSTAASAPAAPPPREADAAGTWRGTLATWGTAHLRGDGRPELPSFDAATPLGLVGSRFSLSPAALQAMTLLYVAWLLGRGRKGLSAARLAQLIGEAGWIEGLGRGQLAHLGLAKARQGRLILRSFLGRLLDGQPPGCKILRSEQPGEVDPPDGLSLLEMGEDDPEDVAARASQHLGCPIALVDLRGLAVDRLGRRCQRAWVEARLFEALPMLVLPSEGLSSTDWLEALAGKPAMLAVVGHPPRSLAHLRLVSLP